MIRRRLVLPLCLLALACQRGGTVPTPKPPAPQPVPEEPQGQGASIEEIADAIDPGPRPALTADVPPWVAEALGLSGISGESAELVEQAHAELMRFEEMSKAAGGDAGLPGVVTLARALALAERAGGDLEQASPEALLVLAKAYRFIDLPALADDRSVFGRMLGMFAQAVAHEGETHDTAELEQLAMLVRKALQGAGELHRRTVAVLLRSAPDHPDVPDVLARLGPRILDEDEALAVGVMQRSLSMRGKGATAAQWLDLAAACHRALDVACGREALAQAEAVASTVDEATTKRLMEGRELAKSAYRAVELKDGAGLDNGLERGEALMDLQRYDEARALYEQLMRHHPDDARPVAGLAQVVLTDGVDFVGAAEVIDRAQPREHLDQSWYELAIGVRATMLIYHLLPQIADRSPQQIFDALRPALTKMRSDIDALEALGVDEGRVLRFLYDLAMEAWPKAQGEGSDVALRAMARGLLPRVQKLHAELPGSRHAYALLLSAAEFSDDRALALGVLDVEPPAEYADALAGRRATAALDLVAAWDAKERVPQMLALLEAASGPDQPRAVRQAVLDGHALARRLGHEGLTWAQLEQGYFALLEEPGASADARLLNNLAAVVVEQGRPADAVTAWIRAVEVAEDETRDMPVLNARVVHLTAKLGDLAGAQENLDDIERLASSGTPFEVKLLARAWQVALAPGGARRKAEKVLRRVAAEEAKTNLRPRNLPGEGGVIMRGTFQVGLGYSTLEGMQLQLDIAGVPWLMAPCEVPVPDPRR